MSYRIRFTKSNGETGLWMRDFFTIEKAKREAERRQDACGWACYVEEVVETAAVPAWREEPPRWMRELPRETIMDMSVKSPEARIRELEAEIAQLRDAYDAARQDLKVAKRRLATAINLGDAMHRAHPSEEWAAYKEELAASRQGPAKASEAPGEGHHSGKGAK